jgi:hypothetical protein
LETSQSVYANYFDRIDFDLLYLLWSSHGILFPFFSSILRGEAKCAAFPHATAFYVVGWLERAQHGFVLIASPMMLISDGLIRSVFFWFGCSHCALNVANIRFHCELVTVRTNPQKQNNYYKDVRSQCLWFDFDQFKC